MLKPKPNDKVQVKTGDHVGERAVIERVRGSKISVRLEQSGARVELSSDEITNYSLAARKAWEKMPNKRVGRPKGSKTSNRVSVTLRIDRELWAKFKAAESSGKIWDRTATINAWMQEKLDDVTKEQRTS